MLHCDYIYKRKMFSSLKGLRVQGSSGSEIQNISVYLTNTLLGAFRRHYRKTLVQACKGGWAEDIGRIKKLRRR